MTTTERFIRDIAKHTITVVSDEGVNRHLHFQRPGTMCMHFDIITWPGYLCYTGDMGTYVFRREQDMIGFFRKGRNDKPYRIDFRYWAEKVEAADKCDGIEEFSSAAFQRNVRDYFEQRTGDDEERWPEDRKSALWAEIKSEVLDCLDETSEGVFMQRLYDFSHDGFSFQDWEYRSKEYSHRFLWCCHALEWAIKTYDAYKNEQKNADYPEYPAMEAPAP